MNVDSMRHIDRLAGDIGSEDGGQPPFDPRLCHKDCPNTAIEA